MARGGYTFDDVNRMTWMEIQYICHYQNIVERQRFEELGTMLGVLWDVNETKAAVAKPASKDKVFIPLSVVINPKILDMIYKKTGADSQIGGAEFTPPEENAKVLPMADLSKEDFLKMLGRRSGW